MPTPKESSIGKSPSCHSAFATSAREKSHGVLLPGGFVCLAKSVVKWQTTSNSMSHRETVAEMTGMNVFTANRQLSHWEGQWPDSTGAKFFVVGDRRSTQQQNRLLLASPDPDLIASGRRDNNGHSGRLCFPEGLMSLVRYLRRWPCMWSCGSVWMYR